MPSLSIAPLPWIGLAGPTASGKTSAALALAQHWAIEIISVDSALVYQGMDIGTAKPTAAERAQVPHHLIDILDPAQTYSAAQFVAQAQALITDIHHRGRWPVLVGGTMLYFKALIEGISPLPSANAAVRAQLDQDAMREGWPALHARLAQIDAPTAQRLDPNDAQRIQRALEVWLLSGRSLSAHLASPAASTCPPLCLLSLEPQDRAALHARIETRFAHMLDEGLIEEVQALRARDDLHPSLPSMRCVGYRQTWEALETRPLADWTPADHLALHQRGSAATRQLAKRQLTWLRAMPQRQAIAIAAFEQAPKQVMHALSALKIPPHP